MKKKRASKIHKCIRPQGTYEDDDAWITPLGEHNIVHYDCPTDDEIRQRVKDVIEEFLREAVEKPDCPLCAMTKWDIENYVYYCAIRCYKCKKAKICKNFNPNSKKEEKEDRRKWEKLMKMSEEEQKRELGLW